MRCLAATTHRSESAACGCRPVSASGSRWPARSCVTLPCCCSTSPPLIWIRLGAGLIASALDTELADRTVILISHGRDWAVAAGGRVLSLDHGMLAVTGGSGADGRPAAVTTMTN